MCLQAQIGLKSTMRSSIGDSVRYMVRMYYSGYISKVVDAESEEEALLKARKEPADMDEILPTLERWESADEVVKED